MVGFNQERYIMNKLKDKTAVIVGATGDIGSSIAEGLAREGANLILAARKIETLAPIANRLESIGEGRKIAIQTDATKSIEVQNLIDRTDEIFGRAHILITSVGEWQQVDLNSSFENFAHQLEIDLNSFVKAAELPIYAFYQHFRTQGYGGLIVDISSHAAEGFLPGNLTYAQAKTAVKVLLEHLKLDPTSDPKIKVSRAIAQLIDTEKNRRNNPQITEDQWKSTVQIRDITNWIAESSIAGEVETEKFFKSGVIL